ncbi:MAG: cyclic nucleotide-binding domain-containing protein [Elusimicrobia bacterium]|nr:cyclic nucleotide-binding domain-containing protein [Elusimicrobiota bacterium]
MGLSRWLKGLWSDPATSRKRAFLKSQELFKDLSFIELGQLAQCIHTRSYQEGEVLFAEGDIGRALFLLEQGRIDLAKSEPDGRRRTLYTAEPGDFFGEMALLEQLPRTATATATERSRVHLLYRSKLDSLRGARPRIGVVIMTHLAQMLSARLRHANSRLAQAAAPPPVA